MDLSIYFRILGDRTRLRLINLLISNEFNVNEIVTILGMTQPRISRHLKVLSDNGLVSFRRDGLWIFYSIDGKSKGYEFIKTINIFFTDDPELKSDIERGKKIIENRIQETARFFDSIAGNWTKLKEDILGGFDIKNLLAKYMRKCSLAVDIGCGNGDLIPEMLKYADRVIGVDRSIRMLDYAKKNSIDNDDRISLRLGEAEYLPLGDNEVDFAVANMMLHHLSTPQKAISEIHRILKKKGSLIIIDLLKHENELLRIKHGDRWLGFDKKDILTWTVKAGFTLEEDTEYSMETGLSLISLLLLKN